MSNDSQNELSIISAKLNVIIALLLRDAVTKGTILGTEKAKQIGQQARYLASVGLSAKDISVILDAPLPSVRTLLTPSQRKK